MYNYCTIITENYLPYALALFHSLTKFRRSIHMNIFISDSSKQTTEINIEKYEGISFFFSEDLCLTEIAKTIRQKYRESYHDAFRWSMKPVFINHLIIEKGIDKLIYVDSDIFFFNDPAFLLDKLDSHNVLLTPHWRSSDPHKDSANFQMVFNSGIYNAGFIGVNKHATAAMNWWAMACAYSCEVNTEIGSYVDQTYLNLFHVLFDKVLVLKHRGCNVANWNQLECKRYSQNDGTVLINNEYPIVFIHFTSSTIRGILDESDSRLLPYLLEYQSVLEQQGINLIEKLRIHVNQQNILSINRKTLLSKVRSRIRLRSRLKKVFL